MHYLVYLIPHSFFEACERTFVGSWVTETGSLFGIIETIHIMGLAVLLGTLLVVDMRLLGIGRPLGTPSELASDLRAWTIGSLLVMLTSGIAMFLSEATRMSRNAPFYYKMLILLLALTIHFTLHRRATTPGIDTSSSSAKMIACASLTCWFGVALLGRLSHPFL
jgi:hypothetical protein